MSRQQAFPLPASVGRLLLCSAASLVLAGCAAYAGTRTVPAPSGALAATPVVGNRVAILAGGPQAKSVTIVSLDDGTVARSFGVTREANGIADAGNGSLLVSVGGVAKGRDFGAVELWGNDGMKHRIVPLPARALGMTRDVEGETYILLAGRGKARAAVPLDIQSLHVGKAIPLDADAQALQQCNIGATTYLLYESGTNGPVVVRNIDSGQTLRSQLVAGAPDCGSNGHVYAIAKGFASRTIVVLSASSLTQLTTAPVGNDATEMLEIGDRHVLMLNAGTNVSTLEVLPDPASAASTT